MAGVKLRHASEVRGDDFYATPREAVLSLLDVERIYLPDFIWEPACGDGAIVLPFREAGFHVHASDLIGRGCPDSQSGVDFLRPFAMPRGIGGIVTNPPYKHAQEFVERALDVVPYVAMLLRLSFLEGQGRKPWLEMSPLARVWVSSKRLPMMHRDGWDGPVSTSTTAYAWFVWDRRHEGAPRIRWFDWRDHI